jgi:hypothetical protein
MSTDPDMKECIDRLRRLETRFTKYLESQGFDTQTRPCLFDLATNVLTVPNINASLKDVLAAIPRGEHEPVSIKLGGRLLATIIIDR